MKKNRLRRRLHILYRMILGRLFQWMGTLNMYIQPHRHFNIKAGYHDARTAELFDDRTNTDEWQRAVYESALAEFIKIGGRSVIDVGCGSGYKLIEIFGQDQTLGIELDPMYEWLKARYPLRRWVSFDRAGQMELEADLVICSDVIEHVKNPDVLLDFLARIRFNRLIISTPERDLVRGTRNFGPPENPAHFREWNTPEFREYVSKWFPVADHIITQDKSRSQVVFCHRAAGG